MAITPRAAAQAASKAPSILFSTPRFAQLPLGSPVGATCDFFWRGGLYPFLLRLPPTSRQGPSQGTPRRTVFIPTFTTISSLSLSSGRCPFLARSNLQPGASLTLGLFFTLQFRRWLWERRVWAPVPPAPGGSLAPRGPRQTQWSREDGSVALGMQASWGVPS